MDGLECCELNKSSMERTARIDSEFYRKSILSTASKITKQPWKALSEYVNVSDGNHMRISDKFVAEGIPYYRGQDANHFFIENSYPICIDEQSYDAPVMHRSHLKKGDVLLSIVGTVGSLSIVYSERKATCSCKLAILRPKYDGIAEMIATFLRGKYGQAQIKRFTRGAVQTGLILEDMDQLIVPRFGDDFNWVIRQNIDLAYTLEERSRQIYTEAQHMLERALGISSVCESEAAFSVEPLSQSFGITGRLDSEYYQPQYRKLEEALFKYDPNCKTLSMIAEYIFTGEYAEEYFHQDNSSSLRYFIRGTDIRDGYVEVNDNICINPVSFSRFVSAGDIITGRVGTIGKFGVIDDSIDGALCSDNILCFHLPNKYAPNVYALYFNNPIIKQLITRLARGSVQQRLNQETLREILVPFISEETQVQMNQKVSVSSDLRKKADHILEATTQAVEIAVEQNEPAALKWLKEKTADLNV